MACDCILVTLNGSEANTFTATPNGNTYYGQPVYQFSDGLFGNWIIRYDAEAQNWYIWISDVDGNITGANIASLFQAVSEVGCPLGNWTMTGNPPDYPIIEVLTQPCEEPLKCLTISYSLPDSLEENVIDVAIYDIVDGYPVYVFTLLEYPTLTFKILYADYGAPFFAGWYLITIGEAGEIISYLDNDGTILSYPFSNAVGAYGWTENAYFNIFNTSEAKECPIEPLDCGCGMKFTFTLEGIEQETIEVTSAGFYNERAYYDLPATDYTPALVVFWNGYAWQISATLGGTPIAQLYGNFTCPIGLPLTGEPIDFIGFWVVTGDALLLKSEGVSCTTCGIEDRIYKNYEAVKLPVEPNNENRGLKDCCNCKYLVLGSLDGDSYKNDITSFWIKLSASGTGDFVLTKNGEATTYNLEEKILINDPNTKYITINWGDVLASDGVGCYEVKIAYNIGGIVGTLSKGIFNLNLYSLENAKYTARVKAVFNLYHESEGIDFTGSNVVSTLRFNGFIGNRQPNTELDNLVYQNRETKTVIRENLNTFEITTDPLENCFIEPLIDLYLLSENELYISDYNYHNFSYDIKDLPVILQEAPEVEYKQFTRKAVLTALVSDKIKNKRTYYK